MQITHDEARKLIHLASDETLSFQQKQILDAHLASCPECNNYAVSIQKMESILQALLQKQWTRQPIPFPVDMLTTRSNFKFPNSLLLATRIAAVGVMFAAFILSAWQFSSLRSSTANPVPPSIPPVPLYSTSTLFASATKQNQTCEAVSYIVQENDTLKSIANRFSTSKKEIMVTNRMKSELVITGTKLVIPVCNFTPTEAANTSTITFTPSLHAITATPGG